jgi:quercetin dioxygenase-like cupin family protein
VEIVLQVADVPLGSRVEQTYGGFVANLVINGEITYRTGEEWKGYAAGDAWSLPQGGEVVEHNTSGGAARTFTAFLSPTGG